MNDFINILENLNNFHTKTSPRIVHRDIKPENILLVDNKWKFIDFGISAYDKATRKNKTLIEGSCDYLAPEEVATVGGTDREHFSSSCDIWAMGMILYKYILHIKTPYPDAKEETIFTEITKGPNGLRTDSKIELPLSLKNIIKKALAIHPEDRYPNAHVFAEELRKVLTPDYFKEALDAYVGRKNDGSYGNDPDYKKAYESCKNGDNNYPECTVLKCIILAEKSYVPDSIEKPEIIAEQEFRHLKNKLPPDYFESRGADRQWMAGKIKELGLGEIGPNLEEAKKLYKQSSDNNSPVGSYLLYKLDNIRKLLDFSAQEGYCPAV